MKYIVLLLFVFVFVPLGLSQPKTTGGFAEQMKRAFAQESQPDPYTEPFVKRPPEILPEPVEITLEKIDLFGKQIFFRASIPHIIDTQFVVSQITSTLTPSGIDYTISWVDKSDNDFILYAYDGTTYGEFIINNIRTNLGTMNTIFPMISEMCQTSAEWNVLPSIAFSLGMKMVESYQYVMGTPPPALAMSLVEPVLSLAKVAYPLMNRTADKFMCADPRRYQTNCTSGWALSESPTAATVFDVVNNVFVTSGGDCNGMCGPGCCCWLFMCGDCCKRPLCLFLDVVSCSDGNTFRCWSDTFVAVMYMRLNNLTCDYNTWPAYNATTMSVPSITKTLWSSFTYDVPQTTRPLPSYLTDGEKLVLDLAQDHVDF